MQQEFAQTWAKRGQVVFNVLRNRPGIRSFSPELSAYQLVLTALFVYLYRITGENRLTVSSPISGRFDDAAKVTAGHFIEMLPVSIDIAASASFHDIHTNVQQEVMRLLKYAHTGSCAHTAAPYPSVVFNFIPGEFGSFNEFSTDVEWVFSGHIDQHHAMRLHVSDWLGVGVPEISFDFNDACFDESQRTRAVQHWWRVFDGLLENLELPIDAVDIVGDDEQWAWSCAPEATQPKLVAAAYNPQAGFTHQGRVTRCKRQCNNCRSGRW